MKKKFFFETKDDKAFKKWWKRVGDAFACPEEEAKIIWNTALKMRATD